MAAALRSTSACLFLALLRTVPSSAQTRCIGLSECAQEGSSWTSLWYVWLILITVFLLLMCGIGASCIKFCCRKKRPPVETFPPHAHDLTVVPMDHDSTAHSTITSYSSVQYPASFPIPMPFREADRATMNPPAYSLYAIEMPPSYDEAIRMTKPYLETPFGSQKPESSPAELEVPPLNQEPQTLIEPSNGNSEVDQGGSSASASFAEGPSETN